MSPFFIGIGSWNDWQGVGVVSGGGEGDDLIRSIMNLIETSNGMEGFLKHVLGEKSGWRNVFTNTPLESSSGVYPFRLNQDQFQLDFLGNEKGVFLAGNNSADVIEVWMQSELVGEIVEADTLEYRSIPG